LRLRLLALLALLAFLALGCLSRLGLARALTRGVIAIPLRAPRLCLLLRTTPLHSLLTLRRLARGLASLASLLGSLLRLTAAAALLPSRTTLGALTLRTLMLLRGCRLAAATGHVLRGCQSNARQQHGGTE
jgi:hypothetical protein